MTKEDTVKALNVHIDGSIDCSNCPLKDMPECFKYLVNEVNRLLKKEDGNITEEQAIDKLTESGWLFEHDRIMTRRPKGKWVEGKVAFYNVCSICGAVVTNNPNKIYLNDFPVNRIDTINFCPNCGADMR